MRALLLAALAVCGAGAWGAPGQRPPHLGYVYPAGGRQGTVFQVIAGGQNLNGTSRVYVSGEGVRARVVWQARPLTPKDLRELRPLLLRPWRQRRNAVPAAGAAGAAPGQTPAPPAPGRRNAGAAESAADHPVVRELQKLGREDLQKVFKEYFGRDTKRQPNAQIAQTACLEITIDAGAEPGDRELRLASAGGLTNPMRFEVGTFAEVREDEPFGVVTRPTPTLTLPAVLNGQITPGDTDRFRFRARRGQRLVAEAHARSLIPYLADAVPGWFQAAVALYDAKGREVAFADDYRFSPDPVLFYEIPADGDYELEVRDAIYRGREDFVYRIAVGEQPFITRMFPLGGRAGAHTVASIAGWNLPEKRLPLDTRPGGDAIRQATLRYPGGISNPVSYAVDTLPEQDEQEPNDAVKAARRIALPVAINGIIARPGDVDRFRFQGRAGDEVVAEVQARRLGSPLDSLLRLTDAAGRVLAWNDDCEDKGAGLITHQADSYLRARLPRNGAYFVQVADSQRHGDESYGYRLRVGSPRPDFALRATPSSASISATGVAQLTVYALRRDGFDGEIELALKDMPAGFRLSGGRIPRGRECVRLTLAAPRSRLGQPVAVRLEGRARIGGETVARAAVPADDMTQAFAYRHLVPARDLLLAASNVGRRAPPVELAAAGPVRVPAGGSVRVQVRAAWRWVLSTIRLELSDPPKGVTLEGVAAAPGGLAFTLKADGAGVKPGYTDNLIVEAFTEVAPLQQNAKAARRTVRVPLGVLPAIPFEIVK